jgi:hypothetical protein
VKHYQLAEWVDYVRGLAPEREQLAMTAHLTGGCRRCQSMARWLTRLNTIAEADARYRMPEDALEVASAIYTERKAETPRREARWRGRTPATRALRRTTEEKKDEAD